MKKRILVFCLLVVFCVICLVACDKEKTHEHEFGEWQTTIAPECDKTGERTRACKGSCSYKETEIIDALGHSFASEFIIDLEPTCTAAGSKSKHCVRCSEKTEITEILAKGHTYGDWETISAPTCTEQGKEKRTCTTCEHFEEREITALGHSFASEFTIDLEPTCTAMGSKSKHCVHCSEKTEITEIPAKGHTYGDWETITTPTCTEQGKEKRICTTCEHFEEREITNLGHDWSNDFTVDKVATCMEVGSKSKHCSHCDAKKDEEIIPIKEHNYQWEITTIPTETKDGEKREICQSGCGHIRNTQILYALGTEGLQYTANADRTEYSISGYIGNAKIVHIPAYHDGQAVTAIGANAFEQNMKITEVHMKEGIKYIGDNAFYFCMSINKFTLPRSLEVIGKCAFYACPIKEFAVGENISIIGDFAFRYCEFSSIIIPLNVAEIGVSPFTDIENLIIYAEADLKPERWWFSWNFTGNSEDSYHTVYWAGEWHIDDKGSPTPHSFGEWQVTKIATCTEKGLQKRICSGCNHEKTEEIAIDAAIHNYSNDFIIDLEPTCTMAGSKSKHCARCSEKTEVSEIPPKGHTYGDWETTIVASCISEGEQKRVCFVCGHEERKQMGFGDHDWETDFTVDNSPTCESEGSNSIHCKLCTERKNITVVPATGHYYQWITDIPATETADGVETEYCFNNMFHTRNTRPLYATGTAGLVFVAVDGSSDYQVNGFTGTATEIFIPSYHMGGKVIYVNMNAFKNNTTITKVTIGNNITNIYSAFQGCTELVTVILPDSLKVIGNQAFTGCKKLTNLKFGNGLKRIGTDAFRYCEALTNITIPDSVEEIMNDAFGRCYGLQWAIVPANISTIGEGLFYLSENLNIFCKSTEAGSGWHSLWQEGNKAVYFAEEWCYDEDGIPTPHIYDEWFIDTEPSCYIVGFMARVCAVCGAKQLEMIPDLGHNWNEWETTKEPTCTNEGEEQRVCKRDSSHIEYRSIPKLEHTGEWGESTATETADGEETKICTDCGHIIEIRTAYATGTAELVFDYLADSTEAYKIVGYTGIAESVYIPKYHNGKPVDAIAGSAFAANDNITSVIISDGVTRIVISAFSACTNLVSIIIPSSITFIAEYVFYNCKKLTVFCEATEKPAEWSNLWNVSNCEVYWAGDWEVSCDGAPYYKGTQGLEFIANGDTEYSVSGYVGIATEVKIPAYYQGKPVKSIRQSAFQGNYTPVKVIIPYGITTIGNGAFYSCAYLADITIPNSVISIGDNAFNTCIELQTVTIPDSVTTIGKYIFENCNKLESVILGVNIPKISNSMFRNCRELTNIIIPDKVESIETMAFVDCTKLTSITIYAVNPPTLAQLNVFTGSPNIKIYVPQTSLAAYKIAENWINYADKIFAI